MTARTLRSRNVARIREIAKAKKKRGLTSIPLFNGPIDLREPGNPYPIAHGRKVKLGTLVAEARESHEERLVNELSRISSGLIRALDIAESSVQASASVSRPGSAAARTKARYRRAARRLTAAIGPFEAQLNEFRRLAAPSAPARPRERRPRK